jgi:nucleotide-binding universal stress UspA family protein
MRRILVALDGSSESEQILGEVARIGSAETAVDLVHVLDRPQHEIPNAGASLEDVAEEYLHRAAGRLPGRRIRTFLWRGEPEEEIPRAAEALHADLIAMTTHARRGLSHLLMGSVAEAVVRTTSLPVLLTRPGLERPVRPLERILVAVDGTEKSRIACTTARELAAESGAELVLLQVVEPVLVVDPVTGFTPIGIPDPAPDPMPALEDLARRLRQDGVAARALVTHGAAAGRILDGARAVDADLIVLSTLGRRGLSRIMLGSVAEEVVRHMDRPVLLQRVAPVMEAKRQAQTHSQGAD